MSDQPPPLVVETGELLRQLVIAVKVRPLDRPSSFRSWLGGRLIVLGALVAGFAGARFEIERPS